jgi:hypothetical protein
MRPPPLVSSFAERVAARVGDADVAAFQRDGAVFIRGLLNADELALLASGIETNLAAPSPRAKIASRPDDPGFFIEDFCNWQEIDAYRRFIVDSPLALLAQRLMGSRTVRLYHDHLLVKEPGTRQRTPWHQDQPYYNIEGTQTVSMWIPVDPVPRAATLEFVAGSHLGPWLMPRTFMDNQAKWFPEGSLKDLPAIESNRAAPRIRSSAGMWNPATLSASTCSRCTRPRASPARTAGACSRCAFSATMCGTHRARGSRRRRSRGWQTNCRRVPKWTTRCSRS